VHRNIEFKSSFCVRKRPQPQEPIDFEFELTPDSPVFIPHLGLTVKISKATQHAALSTQHSQCVELPHGDEPKVILCTTENDISHISRAFDAGANEYVMKPSTAMSSRRNSRSSD